jgi:SRSO17 transposase
MCELYLPEDWTSDLPRRREAGIPDEVTFAAKPELARRMLQRVCAAGLPAAWVTGDTVYGGNTPLRAWLEEQRQPYVLAIAANDGVDLPGGGSGPDIPMHVLPRGNRGIPPRSARMASPLGRGRFQGAAPLRLGVRAPGRP